MKNLTQSQWELLRSLCGDGGGSIVPLRGSFKSAFKTLERNGLAIIDPYNRDCARSTATGMALWNEKGASHR